MAGDEDAGLGVVPVGERNAGIGRATRRRGHAGTDLEGNAVRGELFDLLAAAPENEGVAALQPQDALALPASLTISSPISSCGTAWLARFFPT